MMTQASPLRLLSPRAHGYRFNWVGRIGLCVILFWAVIAVIGPWIMPYPEGKIVDWNYFDPMSTKFWLGTDYLGRDILSRIIMGARYTVGIALGSVILACVGGVVLGMVAAVVGGWFDMILSRLLDAFNG
ncbi:ABC transporter permease, partial [Thioclava sp. BHET1]